MDRIRTVSFRKDYNRKPYRLTKYMPSFIDMWMTCGTVKYSGG